MKYLFFSIFIINHYLYAFTYQKTSNGTNVNWSNSNVTFYVDSTNSSGIDDSAINSIVQSSLNEWNTSSGLKLYGSYGSSSTLENRNDIVFSNSDLIFNGSSVLAVTRNIFNDTTGAILESDIYIKDSITFSEDQASELYIGSILSHEIGHSLGLDHSNNLFSTMFYQLVKGQASLDSDDIQGRASLYNLNTSQGVISGTIAGSSNKIGVFGATVKLISSREGKVISSVLTEENGYFSFTNIDFNDIYYIYVQPTKIIDNLSSHYEQVKSDFCSGFAQYEGSFFGTCDRSRRGKPQGIVLTTSSPSLNLGIVTIKCGLEVPTDYYTAKENGFNLNMKSDHPGDSFVGFFTKESINNSEYDEVNIDLSSYVPNTDDLSLDIKLVSHDLYSQVSYELEVSGPSGTSFIQSTIDDDGNPRLNLSGQFALDTLTPANNIFNLKVKPESITSFLLSSSFSSLSQVIPAYSSLGSDKAFYQLIIYVVKKNGSDDEIYSHYPYLNNRDNSSCMDGPKTYGVKSSSSLISSQISSSDNELSNDGLSGALACGSILLVGEDNNDDDGNSGMLLQLLMGFLMALVLSFVKQTKMT